MGGPPAVPEHPHPPGRLTRMTNPDSPVGCLAFRLRELRIDAGLNAADVAKEIGISGPQLSRIESGKRIPSPKHVDALCRFYRCPEESRSALVGMAEDIKASRKRVVLSKPTRAEFQKRLGRLAAQATAIRSFSPTVIPGAIQTPAYIQAVWATGGGNQAEGSEFVAERLANQALYTDPAKQVTILMTEGAVEWTAGSPALMVTQCEHIAERIVAGMRIGIIPFGVPAAVFPTGGFTVYDESAVVPSILAVQTVLNPPNVAAWLAHFRELERMAVFDDGARAILARVAGRFRELR